MSLPRSVYDLLELLSSRDGEIPDAEIPRQLRNAIDIGKGLSLALIDKVPQAGIVDFSQPLVEQFPVIWRLTPHGKATLALHRETEAGRSSLTGVKELTKVEEPIEQVLPEGTRYREDDVPAAYREGGKPNGAVLTTKYLAQTTEWNLLGPYLSRNYGPGKTLTNFIKVGRQKAYLFKEVAALRTIKTANEAKREEK